MGSDGRPVTTFTLPDLGEGLPDAEIVTWHVGPGDRVVADQPLVAVETDKAVVEIPSPRSGYVERLRADEGAIVRVGQPLVDFSDDGPADAGTLVGRLAPTPATSKGAPTAGAEPRREPAATTERATGRATPAVRARATRLGVDLSLVTGSGPDGTVTAADVDAAAAAAPGDLDVPAVTTGPLTATATEARTADIEPLRGVRRSMAANMARAGGEVVRATVHDVVDIGGWGPAEDPTVRLIRAVGVACGAEPSLNMTFHGPGVGRSANATVDLGVAVDTKDGLFVPVLRNVAARAPAELRTELDALMAAVAARSVVTEDLRGPTITLSNFGSMGGRHGVLVVMPPQVAIVGAGRIHDAVVARDGRPEVRRVLPLSLTFDHRAVTGGEAARFLSHLIIDLEAPS